MIKTTVQEFVTALKSSLVLTKKQTIPVLGYVRVTDNTVSATDLDCFTIIPFESKGEGDFMLPYKQTLDVLSGEKGQLLMLEYIPEIKGVKGQRDKDAKVKLNFSGCEFLLETVSVSNFPEAPKQAETTLHVEDFKTLLDHCTFAISQEASRYTLNGALLTGGETVTMVATDAHRLSLMTTPGDGKIDKTIISTRALDWLNKNIGPVSIGVEGSYQTFVIGNKVLISRIISGQYPNYEAVMPRERKITATFPSGKDLLPTLTRVMKCSDDRSHCVEWEFNGKATIYAESSERGSAKSDLNCSTSGGEVLIGWNGEYVQDFLKVVGDRPFTVSIRDNQSAAMFQAGEFQYVVMPMRL